MFTKKLAKMLLFGLLRRFIEYKRPLVILGLNLSVFKNHLLQTLKPFI